MKSPTHLRSHQKWLMERILLPSEASKIDLVEKLRNRPESAFPLEKRLAVYADAYRTRLVESLESEYPVLRHALGESLFQLFAADYLQANPPTSPSLADLGAGLPDFLRRTKPTDLNESWPDFLVDLSALERTFSEVYRGTGPENSAEPPREDTESILTEDSSRKIDCRFPVHRYFLEVRKQVEEDSVNEGEPVSIPEAETVSLLLYRRGYRVRIRDLPIEIRS